MHVNNVHATMAHLLGLDYDWLTQPTCRYGERAIRLMNLAGMAANDVVSQQPRVRKSR